MDALEKKRLKFFMNLKKEMEELGITLNDINDVAGVKKPKKVVVPEKKKEFFTAEDYARVKKETLRFLSYGWDVNKIVKNMRKATGHKVTKTQVYYIKRVLFDGKTTSEPADPLKISVHQGKTSKIVENL